MGKCSSFATNGRPIIQTNRAPLKRLHLRFHNPPTTQTRAPPLGVGGVSVTPPIIWSPSANGREKKEEEREGKGERMGGRLLLSAILILGSSFNWPPMYGMPTLLFFVWIGHCPIRRHISYFTTVSCRSEWRGGHPRLSNFSRCRHFKASRQIDVAT